jgi:hypothetical protein
LKPFSRLLSALLAYGLACASARFHPVEYCYCLFALSRENLDQGMSSIVLSFAALSKHELEFASSLFSDSAFVSIGLIDHLGLLACLRKRGAQPHLT